MVNLYQLLIFVTVSDRGSFSAAAEQLSLTQPGVSQHIRALEEAYKVRLFNRNGPHIELTEAGLRLLEVARPLVKQAEHLEETFSAELGEVRGRVSMVYSRNATSVLYLLPPLLAEFHERHRGVRFSLVQARDETVLDMLLDREAHFALLSNPPRQKSLEYILLHSDELAIVLPPGHAWHQSRVELRELKGQPFLLRTGGSETRRQAEILLRGAGLSFSDLKVVAELDSVQAIVQAARAGLGLGFVSGTILQSYASSGQVGCANLHLTERQLAAGLDLKREIFVTRSLAVPTLERAPSQERFWEFLRTRRATAEG